MVQVQPDIARKLSHPSFVSILSLSVSLLCRRFFLFHRGGLINETGQAKHYYSLYSTLAKKYIFFSLNYLGLAHEIHYRDSDD